MRLRKQITAALTTAAMSAAVATLSSNASAHCDTLVGPVVSAARQALETNNVNLALIWVKPADEASIRGAFAEATAERQKAGPAAESADTRFFETLVRIHRAGEGAPFTGIKPANTDIGPAVPAADKALETGQVEPVQRLLDESIGKGVQTHFQETAARRHYDPNDVAAGRAYVQSYVQYTHFVEGIYEAAHADHEHGHGSPEHADVGGHDHGDHSGHLPWALAGAFGLVALGQGGIMISRRKKN